ncbi:hypothetical protein SDC9_157531 [bioreactor metagenome]|uniref:Uncharacterized protein n=1 Tax=bioreactor metagenome TaxID=1076179 RepID=A0A645F9D9_9ZZZZ
MIHALVPIADRADADREKGLIRNAMTRAKIAFDIGMT